MSQPQLIVLDYPGRREEASVADLALESHGYAMRYLLAAPFVRELRADRYAEALLERAAPVGSCSAVLAYCMAAPIAHEVAARMTGHGGAVPLVLFDGEPSSPAAIVDQYQVTLQQYAEQLGLRTAPVADPDLFDAETLAERPAAAVESMRRHLISMGLAALGGHEPDDEAIECAHDLADFYLDWLVHLVAAHNASWPRWGGRVFHVMSRDHAFAGSWPGAASTTAVRFDVVRPELLRHPDVAPAVREFLDGSGGGLKGAG